MIHIGLMIDQKKTEEYFQMTLRVVELFSGMGGMHCAIDLLELPYEIVAAIDINPTANQLYTFNFPHVKLFNRSIETISLKQWNQWQADVWLMSPPCQPFTRQGKQDDLNDRRTDGFVHLMKTILPQLTTKPKYILLENVSGFETSQAHQFLLETLEENHYSSRQYLLSPIQFGIPNSRLRYYLIARQGESFSGPIENRIDHFERLHRQLRDRFPSTKTSLSNEIPSKYNERQCNDQITDECSQSSNLLVSIDQQMIINDFLLSDENPSFELDERQIQRGVHCSDLISKHSQRSFCFTKSYGKYFEGTGSLLCTSSGRIRYFTPKEIANLHYFPSNYRFPDEITVRQSFALLGNSLNVFVVAVLLENLIERV